MDSYDNDWLLLIAEMADRSRAETGRTQYV